MIVCGEAVKASRLASTPLFDAVVDTDVVQAALSLAEKVVQEGRLPKVRDLRIRYPEAEG